MLCLPALLPLINQQINKSCCKLTWNCVLSRNHPQLFKLEQNYQSMHPHPQQRLIKISPRVLNIFIASLPIISPKKTLKKRNDKWLTRFLSPSLAVFPSLLSYLSLTRKIQQQASVSLSKEGTYNLLSLKPHYTLKTLTTNFRSAQHLILLLCTFEGEEGIEVLRLENVQL